MALTYGLRHGSDALHSIGRPMVSSLPLRLILGGTACVLLAACGSPTTPEGYPDVQGVYAAFLSSQFTAVPGGAMMTGGPCPVRLTISSQSRGSFAGTFERGHPCVRGSYQVGGAVERDGRAQMALEGAAAFQGFDQCHHVSGEQWWRGEFRDPDLTLTIDVLLDCPATGQIQTRSTINARACPRPERAALARQARRRTMSLFRVSR